MNVALRLAKVWLGSVKCPISTIALAGGLNRRFPLQPAIATERMQERRFNDPSQSAGTPRVTAQSRRRRPSSGQQQAWRDDTPTQARSNNAGNPRVAAQRRRRHPGSTTPGLRNVGSTFRAKVA